MPIVQQFDIHKIVPSEWFDSTSGNSVWLSGYRMYRISNDDIPTGPKYFDLAGVRVFLVYGSINYLNSKSATPFLKEDGRAIFDTSNFEVQSPVGAYLVLILPFERNGKPGNERETRSRISDIVGLLAALNGRNMVYERLFEYEHLLGKNEQGKNERRVIGEVIINPFRMPVPEIRDYRLQFITSVDKIIGEKPPAQTNRIRLSLRWYESAIYDLGVNAFLKYWIAIETLAMPDTTNIRPISEVLSSIYDLTKEETDQRFQIGRLFSLRGRIVHQGEQIPIRGDLLDYIENIYADLLFDSISQASERRTDTFLKNLGFNPIANIS